jgi:hypothetical protein
MNFPWYFCTSVMHSLCSLYSKPPKVFPHSTQVKCQAPRQRVSQCLSTCYFLRVA